MSYTRLRPGFTLTEDRLAELRAVLPEAFADGKINWDTLRETLDPYLEDEGADAEHYGLFWPGKREARKLAAMPSRGALHPAVGEGVNEDTTRNLFIEGDNLEVLKLLLKSYAGRVKMIYIDPPYNTGNDFVYEDDYSEPLESYLRRTGQVSEQGVLQTTNPQTSGRFHSAWLSMIYPRLFLARALLRDDGFIFVSIDDNEIHNLRQLMNEVFGEESFTATFVWRRRQIPDGRNQNKASTDHEYVLCYRSPSGRLRGSDINTAEYQNPDNDPRGPWASKDLTGLATREQRPNLHYNVVNPETGIVYPPSSTRGWAISSDKFRRYIADGLILWPSKQDGRPRLKRFLRDVTDFQTGFSSMLDVGFTTEGTKVIQDLFGEKVMQFPKPLSLIKTLVRQASASDDIVLDFFAGSCTTAHAVLDVNREDGGRRRFIMIQLPEGAEISLYPTVAAIGKERMRRVIHQMQSDNSQPMLLDARNVPEDLGFRVFKLTQSDFKPWPGYAGTDLSTLEGLLTAAETPLADGWTPWDVITEVMLLQGFPLDSAIERDSELTANSVMRVTSDSCGHALYVCLDNRIADETVRQIHLDRNDVFVCLDSALSDESKMRLADVCNLQTI